MTYKRRYKPFYKQFLRLRVNIQNRQKLFKFKRKKWLTFQKYSGNQLKFFKRFKLKDQFRLFATRFASRGNSFQKNLEIIYKKEKCLVFFMED